MNKKIILMSIIVLLVLPMPIVSAGFFDWFFGLFSDTADEYVDGRILIVNEIPQWNLIKHSGTEKDLIFWTANAKEKKTELGWVPKSGSCTGWTDKYLYGADGELILDDKDKSIKLKCESSKCDGANCYHITLTDAAAVNIDEYVKLGNESSVILYQETQSVLFSIDDYNNITATLYWDVYGDGSDWNNSVNDIFVSFNQDRWKYGANHSGIEWERYKYVLESSAPLENRKGKYYFKTGLGGYKVMTNDICSKVLTNGTEMIEGENVSIVIATANCSFNSYTTEVEVYDTEVNVTLVNVTTVNLTIETIQYGAVVGEPVKWKKKVRLGDFENASIEIPRLAENITVYRVVSLDEGGGKISKEQELQGGNVSVDEGVNGSVGFGEGDEIEDVKKIEQKVFRSEIEVNIISGLAVADVDLGEGSWIVEFFRTLFSRFTGRAITTEETIHSKKVIIDESSEVVGANGSVEYEIEYETEAPMAFEQNISDGKRVVVSGPDELHYENVRAFAELPEQVPAFAVKLYHVVNTLEGHENTQRAQDLAGGLRQRVSVEVFDLDENGLVDYVEWIVPSLSNQTYEIIIEITKAEHLDFNRTFVEDVYEYVRARDDNWTAIPDGDYLRVVFEQELDSSKDITIYAKAGCNVSVVVDGVDVPCDVFEKKMRIDEIRRLIE